MDFLGGVGMANLAIIPKESALQMFGVVAPGVPNQERVVMRANVDIDLSGYFLVTGWRFTDDRAWPMNQDSFWFGKTTILAGHWVVVYTGVGQQAFTYLGSDPCIVLHWNKGLTLFHVPEVVPILIHIDTVAVGKRM